MRDADDYYTLKIKQGIKAPVPSIPVKGSGNIAYIKEGLLSLSTAEEGGRIFYTTDGNNPAMFAGGSTSEFLAGTPIVLSTEENWKLITVKAITVTGTGTDDAASSEVMAFNYYVIPGARHHIDCYGSSSFTQPSSPGQRMAAMRIKSGSECQMNITTTVIRSQL